MEHKTANFGKDFIVYAVGAASQMVLSFILLPILTKLFNPTEYGLIDISTTIIQIVSIGFGFRMTTAVSFYYYFHNDEHEKKQTVTTGLLFLLVINILTVFLLSINATSLGAAIYKSPAYTNIFKITIFVAGLSVLQNFLFHLLRISRRASLYVVASLLKGGLQVGIIILFVISFGLGLRGYFYGYLSTVFLSLLIIFSITKKYLTFSFSKKRLIELLKYGVPLIPAGISLWALQLVDRFFLIHYATLADVGLYGVGVRSTILLVLLISSLQLAWGPFAFSIMKQDDAKKVYTEIFSLFVIIATWLIILTTYFAKEAITLVTTPEYTQAYVVTPFLSFGTFFLGAYTLLSIGINLVNKMHIITTTTIIAAILNIILNFILIPRYGILGAAISTASSYLVSTMLVYFFSQKYYPIDYKMKKNMTIVLISVGYLIGYFTITVEGTIINLIIRALICLSFPVVLYTLKLLTPNQVKSIINTIKSLTVKTNPSN